ncbi:zinc finger C2H2-type domain protein [Dehalogenimonas lykanthroporepellens BL-DC-9]|nr:zinc finger C2H2-type domain protein [Dehalogenimonas lykanthroporepellens BL-DC-9]
MGIQFINITEALSEPARYRKKTITIPIFVCPVCGAECKYNSGLRGHVAFAHPEIGVIEERKNGKSKHRR